MKRDEITDLGRMKEVKVMIPINQHIRLHSVKVLTGKPISNTVTEALDQYFQTRGVAGLEHQTQDAGLFSETVE